MIYEDVDFSYDVEAAELRYTCPVCMHMNKPGITIVESEESFFVGELSFDDVCDHCERDYHGTAAVKKTEDEVDFWKVSDTLTLVENL